MTKFNIAEASKELRNAIREYNATTKKLQGVSDAVCCSVKINRQWETLKAEPRSVLYMEGLYKSVEGTQTFVQTLVEEICEKYGLKRIGQHRGLSVHYTLVKKL